MPAFEPAPAGAPAPRRDRGRLLGPLAALAALLAKFKAVLLLLPKLKLLTTSGSMLVSVAAYSFVFGWRFAVGFVLLLFVHELGHVIQLRREGIPASAPLFIPFLGAVVAAKSLGGNAAAEARVGLAGPVLGTLGTIAVAAAGLATGSDLLQALAFTGFFLNLFNLLPVVPLDGGRAMAALSPWMWFVGLAGLIVLVLVAPNPILLLILLFGAMETWKRWRARRSGAQQEYYRVTRAQRLGVFAVYLLLLVVCAGGMDLTHVVRTFGDA